MKSKKNFVLIIGLVALVIIAAFVWNNKKIEAPTEQTGTENQNPENAITADVEIPSKAILFYSNTCPHCKVVEEYITKNNITNKIDLEQKEVSSDVNVQLLLAIIKKCELPQDSIGVPFLWTGGATRECIIGDQDIIAFFANYNK